MVDEVDEVDETQTFDVSDIAERAFSTAVQVAAAGVPALFIALKGENSRAAVIAFVVTAGSAALSVLKNAAKQYFNARKARVQF